MAAKAKTKPKARSARAKSDSASAPYDKILADLAAGRSVPLTPALLRQLVTAVDMAAEAKPDPRDSAHDRLFAALMARLDALQQKRAGYLALLDRLQRRPDLLAPLVLRLGRSCEAVLADSGLALGGLRTRLQTAGLLAVYVQAVRVWRRDDSRDLAGTMRALDQRLRPALQAGAWLGLPA